MSFRSIIFPYLCVLGILGLPTSLNRSIQEYVMCLWSEMFLWHSSHITDVSINRSYLSSISHKNSLKQEKKKYPHVMANVILHAHGDWSHVLWVDQGENAHPFPIQQNCPVLVDDVLIGIVDFVGHSVSRIRLLSDPFVRPAVRVVRRGIDRYELSCASKKIQSAIEKYPNLMPSKKFSNALHKLLNCFVQKLPEEEGVRLAKGELQGAVSYGSPMLFRGVGFNYEYRDEYGERRDLRTGQKQIAEPKIPLILPGDLLETSGFDGHFPRGLRVATVLSVSPLPEGATSYDILVKSEIPHFEDVEYVTIIPPQPQEVHESPNHFQGMYQNICEEMAKK